QYRRLFRGLRFRLMASYALFFALILVGVAGVFRARLATLLDNQSHDLLDNEWAAMKGYLRIERDGPHWYYDDQDPDETFIVERLRRVYLLTDANGKMEQVSTDYQNLGIDSPARIQAEVRDALTSSNIETGGKVFWAVRHDTHGAPYLIRSGVVFDEGHHAPFYIALGTPLANNDNILRQVTWIYVVIIPGALILGCLFGWFMAGRGLTPVLAVAQAAQRISGSNLSLRIPTRRADDELDYLILTFNRMIDRLEASFQQMRQFSGDVSHELRTPITAIRGQLEVALFTARTADQYREAILNALQDIDRLSQIVRALLLLSQAESGQLALQKTQVDLSRTVRELAEQFQIPAEAAGVRLSAQVPAECPATVDRVQIERMITNLLSNAVKFTPEGGEVRIKLEPGFDSLEIKVEDTGRGIPEQHLPHIFDRFYRVPGTGTAPGPDQGLGLGLSFVAWIVKAHEGTIDVASTPGKGTRFTVRLPLGQVQRTEPESSVQPIMKEL
ncbi:MAG TPA: heavy metal sensor histidine kinase, partial [Bryobacteraceae bacterium]|nr:heavy metal sensor histidine kinase [Bryobacteraceae bacterium]